LSFVIPVTCLYLSRNVFGWDSIYADNMSGNVIGAVLGNVFRFWAFRRFVFTPRPVALLDVVAPEHVQSPLQSPAQRAAD
jgi:hypothetical protein